MDRIRSVVASLCVGVASLCVGMARCSPRRHRRPLTPTTATVPLRRRRRWWTRPARVRYAVGVQFRVPSLAIIFGARTRFGMCVCVRVCVFGCCTDSLINDAHMCTFQLGSFHESAFSWIVHNVLTDFQECGSI